MAGESGGDGLKSRVWSPNDVVPSGRERGLDAGLPLLRPELDRDDWCCCDCILKEQKEIGTFISMLLTSVVANNSLDSSRMILMKI